MIMDKKNINASLNNLHIFNIRIISHPKILHRMLKLKIPLTVKMDQNGDCDSDFLQ